MYLDNTKTRYCDTDVVLGQNFICINSIIPPSRIHIQSSLNLSTLLKPLQHNPHKRPKERKALKNNKRKGENIDNQHFIFFPLWFLSYQRHNHQIKHIQIDIYFTYGPTPNFVVLLTLFQMTNFRLVQTEN